MATNFPIFYDLSYRFFMIIILNIILDFVRNLKEENTKIQYTKLGHKMIVLHLQILFRLDIIIHDRRLITFILILKQENKVINQQAEAC